MTVKILCKDITKAEQALNDITKVKLLQSKIEFYNRLSQNTSEMGDEA